MSGLMSRRKGAAGERELLRKLGDELGQILKRNLAQTREGGADCIDLGPFAIEVKRQEALSRPKWWDQAVFQALLMGRRPIVFYRRSREPWRALLPMAQGQLYRGADWLDAVSFIREELLKEEQCRAS